MALNTLVDSFLPQSEKCETERVKLNAPPQTENIFRQLQNVRKLQMFRITTKLEINHILVPLGVL